MISGMQGAIPQIKAEKVRALAVTGKRRSPALPDVPTVSEALGLRDYEALNWQSLLFPPGTPKPVVDKLALDLADALKQADVAQKMNDLGSTVVGNKPDEFRQFVTRQIEMWAEGVKISGATVD